MQGASGIHQIVLVMHQMTAAVELLAVHAAIRAFGILIEFVFQRLGVRLGLGRELQRRAIVFALCGTGRRTQGDDASGGAGHGEQAEHLASFGVVVIIHLRSFPVR